MEEQEKKILEYVEISSGVREFMSEGRFRQGADSGKTLTDVVLDCRNILLVEVEEFGFTVLHAEDLLLDGYRSECLAYLREFFDEDLLREFFCGLSETERENFKILLDDGDEEAQFGLVKIIEVLISLNPNNKKLRHIRCYIGDFLITKEFYDRMWKILRASRSNEPDDPQSNIEIMNYLKHKFEHVNNVRTAAAYFKKFDYGGKLDLVELDSRLSLHDKDLIYGDELKEVVALKAIRDQVHPSPEMKKMADDQILCHYKRSRHHMDCHVGQEHNVNMADIIEILSDIYNKQKTKEEYLEDMEGIMTKVNINDEMKNTLRGYAAKFNIWSDVPMTGG